AATPAEAALAAQKAEEHERALIELQRRGLDRLSSVSVDTFVYRFGRLRPWHVAPHQWAAAPPDEVKDKRPVGGWPLYARNPRRRHAGKEVDTSELTEYLPYDPSPIWFRRHDLDENVAFRLNEAGPEGAVQKRASNPYRPSRAFEAKRHRKVSWKIKKSSDG